MINPNTLQASVTNTSATLASNGVLQITDTDLYEGDFFGIMAINGDAELDKDSTIDNTSLGANITLKEMVPLFLPFKEILLVSGSVLAFKS